MANLVDLGQGLLPHRSPEPNFGRSLDIVLLWLPKQWSKLNGMDQLWRGLKAEICANVQFQNIEEYAAFAQQRMASLSKTEALCKGGVLSENFWLKSFLS